MGAGVRAGGEGRVATMIKCVNEKRLFKIEKPDDTVLITTACHNLWNSTNNFLLQRQVLTPKEGRLSLGVKGHSVHIRQRLHHLLQVFSGFLDR